MVGTFVRWVGEGGHVYRGQVKRVANKRAVQVLSEGGLLWLIRTSELIPEKSRVLS
jgi:hypothetical protein